MRLWHYALIPYLPKSQLLAQWRELNSIFKKQDKHILINYIYEYPKEELWLYTCMVIAEMEKRQFAIKHLENLISYFKYTDESYYIIIPNLYKVDFSAYHPFKYHHNFRYLQQCFYNLQEKFDRGQADFSQQQYEALNELMKKEIPF